MKTEVETFDLQNGGQLRLRDKEKRWTNLHVKVVNVDDVEFPQLIVDLAKEVLAVGGLKLLTSSSSSVSVSCQPRNDMKGRAVPLCDRPFSHSSTSLRKYSLCTNSSSSTCCNPISTS